MKTSLREIQHIEEFLLNKMPLPHSLVFHARVLTHPMLKARVRVQQQIYSLVNMYGRSLAKAEISRVQSRLFSLPSHKEFQQDVSQIFN